jgi:hypothetical protein
MAVSLELHNIGDPGAGAEVRALVEHALNDRPGDWRVSIVGSRANDGWEMNSTRSWVDLRQISAGSDLYSLAPFWLQ